jgi:hypothetical protein
MIVRAVRGDAMLSRFFIPQLLLGIAFIEGTSASGFF